LSAFCISTRVVVAEPLRRRGIAGMLYDAMEAAAGPFPRMVCDVNALPPNEPSLAFHAARGYREVGRLAHGPEKVVTMLSKQLAHKA
jgi:predicted GNAT superfamily acetyltransferase